MTVVSAYETVSVNPSSCDRTAVYEVRPGDTADTARVACRRHLADMGDFGIDEDDALEGSERAHSGPEVRPLQLALSTQNTVEQVA